MPRTTCQPSRRKRPRKVTADSLERAALYYLQRYATSSENLRRVLMRRVHRSVEFHGTSPQDGADLVDQLIARYRTAGLLDDAAYARMRADTLHRRGASRRLIWQKLAAKGVAADVIDGALAGLSQEVADSELAAACNYARRRRLGPWRIADRDTSRDRDLAALARQGFSYDIARRVIEAADPQALDATLREEDGG